MILIRILPWDPWLPRSSKHLARSCQESQDASKRVNPGNEPLKFEQPLLESSSEMDKLACKTNTKHSPHTKLAVMGTSFPAQEFWAMETFN